MGNVADVKVEKDMNLEKQEIPPKLHTNSELQGNNDEHKINEENNPIIIEQRKNQDDGEQIEDEEKQRNQNQEQEKEEEEKEGENIEEEEHKKEEEEQNQEEEEEQKYEREEQNNEEEQNEENEKNINEEEEQDNGVEQNNEKQEINNEDNEEKIQIKKNEEQTMNKEEKTGISVKRYPMDNQRIRVQINDTKYVPKNYQINLNNGMKMRVIQKEQRQEIHNSPFFQNNQIYNYQYQNNYKDEDEIYKTKPLIYEQENQNQIEQGIQDYQYNQIFQAQNQQFPSYQIELVKQDQDSKKEEVEENNKLNYQPIETRKNKKIHSSIPQKQVIQNNSMSKIKNGPKDSNPKIYVSSIRKNEKKRNYQNVNFTSNTNEEQIMYQNRSNIENNNLKKINKSKLKNIMTEFVDIPRGDYDNYENKEIMYINEGMETGEYKFIGERSKIKENFPGEKEKINKNDIIIEIAKRNKEKKQKNVSYEIIDKFYTLTDIRGKIIRTGENMNIEDKKNDFYSNFYYTNDFNKNENIQNKNNTFEVYNYQASTKNKGGYYQSNINANAKVNSYQNNIISKGIKEGNYQMVGAYSRYSGGAQGSTTGNNYIEFKKEIPINNAYNSNKSKENVYQNTILSLPSDNYSKYLLEQINKIRTEPQSFIGVIEDAKANIKKDRFDRIIYDGRIKIALTKGETAFDEAIQFLKDLKPMEALEYDSNIKVIPPRNIKEMKDKEDMCKKVKEMINEGVVIKSYWRDLIKDPEISFLFMIIDDNGSKSGMKRKDLLDPNMKYIGVTSIEIDNDFVCYITLRS